MSEVINMQDCQATVPGETTLLQSLSPLLTSMKLFGLYFKCRKNVGDSATTEESRVRWNVIYPCAVVALLWINALRMFSVFTETFALIVGLFKSTCPRLLKIVLILFCPLFKFLVLPFHMKDL